MKKTFAQGAALAIAAGLLWSTIGFHAKDVLATGVHWSILVLFRVSLAAAFLGMFCLVFRPSSLAVAWRDLPFFAAFGLLTQTLNYNLFFVALSHLPTQISYVLIYVASPVVMFGAAFLFREPLTARKWAALAVSLSGLVLVTNAWEPLVRSGSAVHGLSAIGVLAGIGAGIAYGSFSLFGKSGLRTHRPETFLFWALVFSAAGQAVVVFALGRGPEVLQAHSAANWGRFLWLGLGPTVGGYLFYAMALDRIEAGRAVLLASIEPVSAGVLGFFLLEERMTAVQIIGAAFVLGAAFLVMRPVKPAMKASEAAGPVSD